jgi:hypothetical protein
LPEVPDFAPRQSVGLEKIKCITKPVIRNGEIVRDAQIFIPRHFFNPQSDATDKLYGIEDAKQVLNRNELDRKALFEMGIDFDECVEDLHSQI